MQAPRSTLDQVYSLDLAGVSERLDVSEAEFLAGVARSSEPKTLGQLLEPVAAPSAGPQARGGKRRQFYRDVCLLVPSQQTNSREKSSQEDTSTLEALLASMTRPRIVDHLVVCVPASAPRLQVSAIHRAVDNACTPLGVRVDVLAAGSEAEALHAACKYLHRSSSRWSSGSSGSEEEDEWSGHVSDGFLLVRAARAFDAATFEMMMTASGHTQLSEHGDGGSRAKIATALVSFDVSSDHGDPQAREDAPETAGLFALSRSCLGELEQLFAVENHSWCKSIEDALAYWGTSEAMTVKSVVASDYCNWRPGQSGSGGVSGLQARYQPRNNWRRKSLGESLHNGVGYSGFQIACTTVTDPEYSDDKVAIGINDGKSKLDSTRQGSPTDAVSHAAPTSKTSLLSFGSKMYDYQSSSYSNAGVNSDEDEEESGVSTPDLEAVLGPHEQAFLIQTSSAAGSTTGLQRAARAHGSPRHCELILAVPDRKLAMATASTSTPNSTGLVSLSDLTMSSSDFMGDGSNSSLHQRRGSHIMASLPTAVREIRVEASVRSPPFGRKFSDDAASITAVTSPQSYPMASISTRAGAEVTTTTLQVVVKKQVPLIGYFVLFTADLAVASQGAALTLLTDVPPLLKLFWRISGASIAFLPLAIFSIYQKGFPKLDTRKILLLLLSAVAHTWFNASFLVALSLTSIGHTYIFNNCHSLLLVMFKLMLRQPLSKQEILGAAVGFAGGAVTTLDHHNGMAHGRVEHSITDWTTTLHGDLLAFAGAFGGVAYLLTAKKLRACMDVSVFLCALMTIEALILLFVLSIFRRDFGINLTDVTSVAGPIGWIWHHPFSEIYMVIVGSVIGTMGFVAAMKYFDPLVVSLGMLTEPVVATIIGVIVGVASTPGVATFIGGTGVLFGCMLVILASHRTETRVDVSDAVAVAVKRPPHEYQDRRHSVESRPGGNGLMSCWNGSGGDGNSSILAGAASSIGLESDGSVRRASVPFQANYGSFP